MLKSLFKRISHFLRICILRFEKIICCVLNDPKNVITIDGVSKNNANFTLILNTMSSLKEKNHTQKSYKAFSCFKVI
jgi:hypothetical protein